MRAGWVGWSDEGLELRSYQGCLILTYANLRYAFPRSPLPQRPGFRHCLPWKLQMYQKDIRPRQQQTSGAPFDPKCAALYAPACAALATTWALTSPRRKGAIDPALSPAACGKASERQFGCRYARSGHETVIILPHRSSEVEFEVEFACKFDFATPKTEDKSRT